MTSLIEVVPSEPPAACRDPMRLVYPHGATAIFDPGNRFYRAGDLINGYVLDRFELDDEVVVAILRFA
jgi:hypothetical protein